MSLWTSTKRGLRNAGLAALVAWTGSQSYFRTRDVLDSRFPTAERAAINARAGVSFEGSEESIEKNPRLKFLIETLDDHQKQFGEISVKRVVFDDAPWYAASPFAQLQRVFFNPAGGMYVPFANRIVLSPDAEGSTFTHELAHAESFKLLQGPLGDSLRAIMVDNNGKSLYRSTPAVLALYVKHLDNIISDAPPTADPANNIGFPSDYARTNVHEHVAEIVENIRGQNRGFVGGGDWMHDPAGRGERVYNLLARHGLVEQGLPALDRLQRASTFATHTAYRVFDDPEAAERVLDSLITAHPNASWVHRARLLNADAIRHDVKMGLNEQLDYVAKPQSRPAVLRARNEILRALDISRTYEEVTFSLVRLGEIEDSLGDKSAACRAYTALDRVRDLSSNSVSEGLKLWHSLENKSLSWEQPGVSCNNPYGHGY